MPSLLPQRVHVFCRENQLFQPGDTIIVAISGGADSTALLHILDELPSDLNLVAAYIDHGLRPDETGAEIEFLRQLSRQLSIPFVARPVAVKAIMAQTKCSPEEAARIARYSELEKIREEFKGTSIAVAHTADDQAEEFLIRLIRGSGLKGLSGMLPKNGRVIRPLLKENKATLLRYLANKKLGHCHDSSNDERTFLRNQVRLDLLPLLEKQFNPSIRTTLTQTAEILQQDEALLAQIADDRFHDLVKLDFTPSHDIQHAEVSQSRCATEHPAIQRRILESCCWKMNTRPTFRTILQLQNLLNQGTNGAQLHLAQGLRVHLHDGIIKFFYPKGKAGYRGDGKTTPAHFRYQITGPGLLEISELSLQLSLEIQDREDCDLDKPDTLFADADTLRFPLILRSPAPGEKFRALGSPGKKKIARILSDMKIRADIRYRYPVLACEEDLIAIVGAKLADNFRLSGSTRKVLCICLTAT